MKNLNPEIGSANSHYQIQKLSNQAPFLTNEAGKVEPFGSPKDFPALLRRYFTEEVMGLSPLSIKAKSEDLEKFLMFYQGINHQLNASEWSVRDTRLFIDELIKQEYAPATVNRILASVRSFGKWLRDENIIPNDPCRKIKELQLAPYIPKRVDDLSFHRLMKTSDALVSSATQQYSQAFRNKTMLILLNNSGLRIHEILNLKIWQFQEKGKNLVKVRCKNQKVRDVKISKECCDLIREYLEKFRTDGTDYIFTNRYGKKLSRNGIAKALHRVAGIASVRLPADEKIHVTPHKFRHRHAFLVRQLKGDSFAAQRLGHASLAYIGRYATPDSKEEEELVENI